METIVGTADGLYSCGLPFALAQALLSPEPHGHASPLNTTISDASRKPLFPKGPGLGLKFLLFSLLSLGLIIGDSRTDRLAPIRQWTAWALTPVQWAGGIPQAIGDGVEHFHSREILIAENAQLRDHQLQQEAKLLRLASLESENERIRQLLGSATSLQDRTLIAEILSTSQDPYRHQIMLNKGSRDGVYKGQALVDAAGVMGQVVQVNLSSCVALLITDPDHGIPVEFNRTGLQTIALGRGDGQSLTLPYLPGNADVKVGDLLVSSGLGGRFPAGYPVGEVFELRHPKGDSFMEAIAYPKAKLNQGRQALLVWSEHPTQLPEAAVPVDLHPPPPPRPPQQSEAAPTAAAAPPPAKPKP
jgi:rod shape-determining protein MreC